MMKTIRKHSLILIASLAAAISVIVPITVSYLGSHDQNNELTVYRVENGWGYDIGIGGRIIIHQPFVPALPGNTAFPDRASARAAGRFVLGKILAGESPAMSGEEAAGFVRP